MVDRRVGLTLGLLGFLAACGSNDDGGPGGPGGGGTLKANIGLEMSAVKGFLLGSTVGSTAGGLIAGATSAEQSTVYAVNASGQLTRTTFVESEDGTSSEQTESLRTRAIKDSPGFVVFGVEGLSIPEGDGRRECGAVILRKSDGALFCGAVHVQNEARLHSDASGALLYLQDLSHLYRLDMSDPSSPASSGLLEGLGVRSVAVNAAGDALAAFRDTGDQVRIFKRSGGLQNVSTENVTCTFSGPSGDADSLYYFVYVSAPGPTQHDLHQLTREANGSYVDTKVGTLLLSGMNESLGSCPIALRTADRVYGVIGNALVELASPDFSFTRHPVTGVATVVDAVGKEDTVFLQGTDSVGNGAIVRYHLAGHTQDIALPAGDFSLSAIALAPSGELGFSGLRNLDGKRVVGAVGTTGSYAIVSESAPEVSVMVRLQ